MSFVELGNELDGYNLATYHLTWYMLPPEAIVSKTRGDDWKPSNGGIIIAESGVTSQIFLEELVFTSNPNMGEIAQNATHTEFNMTLRELGGASLIDKIIAASLELGVENYNQAPYFIELTFKANQEPNSSDPVIIANRTFRWPIMIKKVETSVDAGGSSYAVQAFHYDELAQQDVYGFVDKGFSITASTIGGALQELAVAMTKRSLDKSVSTLGISDDYIFDVDPVIAAWPLTSELKDKLNRNAPMDLEKVDNSSFTGVSCEKNVPIVEFINRIVHCAPLYQAAAQQSDTAGQPRTNDPNALKELHRVVTSCNQKRYDVTRGVYAREYTYHIRPYKVGQLIATKEDLKADSGKRFANYLGTEVVAENTNNRNFDGAAGSTGQAGDRKDTNNKLLDKRYYYLFTGINDQIIEFDMTFNYSWYVNVPPQDALNTMTATSNDGGKRFILAKDPTIKEQESANQATSLIAEQVGIVKSQLGLSKKEQEVRIPLKHPDQLIIDKLNEQSKIGRLDAADRVRYVEDIDLQASKDRVTASKFRKHPISFLETSIDETKDKDYTKGLDASNSSGSQYVNSLFNQAFTRPSGDLADIQIKIKGDPYWLGRSIEAGGNDTTASGAHLPMIPEPHSANYGSPAFIFTVRTPELPGVDTGTVRSRTTALNGVYLVKRIDHEFSNGLFTQLLYGCIDPLIDINEVLND